MLKICPPCWQQTLMDADQINDHVYTRHRRSFNLLTCKYDFESETRREERRQNYLVHVRTILSTSDLRSTLLQYSNPCYYCDEIMFKIFKLENIKERCDSILI